ncbi:hypothetical protein SGLAM104S_04058 [Streptomyces glaucescens]
MLATEGFWPLRLPVGMIRSGWMLDGLAARAAAESKQ